MNDEVKVKCGNCEKELKSTMEIEYSKHLSEFFCDSKCATDRYFSYMESTCVDMEQVLPLGVVIDNENFLVQT